MLIRGDRVDCMSRPDVNVVEDSPTIDGCLEGDDEDLRCENASSKKSMFETTDACEQVEDHYTKRRRVTK